MSYGNRGKMTVSGTPGTGTITLLAASSKFQTFASAGIVDGENVYFLVEDGTAWGIESGKYTSSGTTLARGHIESSTGSVLSLTSAATVALIVPGQYFRELDLNIALLAMESADGINIAQFNGTSGNSFGDSFDALTYVDTGGATNLDTGTAGLLLPTVNVGTNAVPTMTGLTTPSGTASATSTFSAGFEAWRAFDHDKGAASNCWFSNGVPSGGSPQELIFDFGTSQSCTSYKVTDANSSQVVSPLGRAPNSWTFEGWNGSSWTVLDTQSGITWSTEQQTNTYTLSSTATGYTKYKCKFTANNGGGNGVAVGELEIIAPGSTNNLTVKSTALTAAVAPTASKIVALVEEIDSITLNTDLVFAVSRDSGTTFTNITMTDKFTANSMHVLDGLTTDISAQPSGTNMKWRITTANNKLVKIRGIYLYWR